MYSKRPLFLCLPAFLISLFPACDTFPAPAPAPAAAVIPLSTNRVRTPQSGDTWSYAIRSRFTKPGTEDFSLWEGTRRDLVTEVTDERFGSVIAVSIAEERTVVEGNGVGEISVDNLQDRFVRLSNGQPQWIGRQVRNTIHYIVSPEGGVTPFPGPDRDMDIGDSYSTGEVVFDDDSRLTHSQVVTAIETVTVPLGTFEAYRIDFTASASGNGDTITEVGTSWFVPALGAHVKLELTRSVPLTTGEQGTEELSVELTSTNVPS